MAGKGRRTENTTERKEKKRSFLASFFEPIPDDDGDGEDLFAPSGDDEFDFDAPDSMDEPDELDDEGAPKKSGLKKHRKRALFDRTEDDVEELPDDEGAKRKKRGAKKKPKKKKISPFKAAFDDSIPDFDDDEEREEPALPTKKKRRKDEKDTGAEASDAAAEETTAPGADGEKSDGARRKKKERIRLFDDDEDRAAVENMTWDDGEKVVPEEALPAQDGTEQAENGEDVEAFADETDEAEEADEADAEPIRLFDDEEDGSVDEAGARKKSARTRIFRTGSASAARIQLNETEELLRIEKTQKERREREAKKKHDEFVGKQRRKRERKQAMQKAFGNMAFGGFIVVAVILAMYYTFLLSDIIIVGNDAYTKEYIVEESGLQYGRHMLAVDLDEAKANIEENPYLQVDGITYIFPSRVRIEITERKEIAGIIGLDYNVIIDRNGYVLSMGGSTDLSDLLQVTGVSMTGFQLGQRLGETDDFSTATLIAMIGKLEEYSLLEAMSAIDLTTPLATTMTAKNGLKIHVGQPTDLDVKMQSLAVLLPQFLRQNITTGTLFLSAKGGTVYSSKSTAEILSSAVAIESGEGDAAASSPDADNDGLDDVTGVPYIPSTPGPTPQPTPMGGGGDEFSG